MKKIHVRTSRGFYSVLTGRGLLARSGELLRHNGLTGKVLVVTQKRVAKYHLKKVTRSLKKNGYRTVLHTLPEGERAKSREELFRLYESLVKADFERGDMVFALGGGVTGDVSGFAAATYLRGIRCVQAGTTLLAQVDSSIGGKTAINLREGKNLAGVFHPPVLVVSDTQALQTLPERDFRASLGEVVKYGVIRDPRLFRLLETKTEKILARDPKLLETIVATAARIKARVVSRDEFETRGERMILNYGHTFGHGFEKAMNYRGFLHGEAVALGMICAAEAAVRTGLLSSEAASRQRRLLAALGLPVSIGKRKISFRQVSSAMLRDKKKKGGLLRFVLPVSIGKVRVISGLSAGVLREALAAAGVNSERS